MPEVDQFTSFPVMLIAGTYALLRGNRSSICARTLLAFLWFVVLIAVCTNYFVGDVSGHGRHPLWLCCFDGLLQSIRVASYVVKHIGVATS